MANRKRLFQFLPVLSAGCLLAACNNYVYEDDS